jgi:ribosome biogenesis GTPase A
MPNTFWNVVNSVIDNADILLLVLDARMVDQTRSSEIEEKIIKKQKRIIYVINKSDLVEKNSLEKIKKEFDDCVFMSAKIHQGTNILRSKIMQVAKGKAVKVGVLGYPNVGKSSVINALIGGGSAPVGHMPGKTRGVQLLRVSSKMHMLDTPGVFPFREKDEAKHILIGSMDPHKAKDPDIVAEYLLEINRYKLWYGIDSEGDGEELLEKIAKKLNYLKLGAKPDLKRTAIKVLMDWQRGKIV